MYHLPADSFSIYKIKVISNKVCIMRFYTIKYCIFRVNRLIFGRILQVMGISCKILLKMSRLTQNIQYLTTCVNCDNFLKRPSPAQQKEKTSNDLTLNLEYFKLTSNCDKDLSYYSYQLFSDR